MANGRGATKEDVNNWFTYHAPIGNQVERYEILRDRFRDLGHTILDLTPSCPDQTAALRMLREASMAVNQTIACNKETAIDGT